MHQIAPTADFYFTHGLTTVGEVLVLDYGFQLECRFDKKFEVNAAHNPMRSAAQMKEDAARCRAFELLLTELYGGSGGTIGLSSSTRCE